jgi:hypothetical protein
MQEHTSSEATANLRFRLISVINLLEVLSPPVFSARLLIRLESQLNRVYIGGIPDIAQAADLVECFGPFGVIKSIDLRWATAFSMHPCYLSDVCTPLAP